MRPSWEAGWRRHGNVESLLQHKWLETRANLSGTWAVVSKTVVGKPAKPFDSIDEKYFVPCKPVQRVAAQVAFSAVHSLAWRMSPIHAC